MMTGVAEKRKKPVKPGPWARGIVKLRKGKGLSQVQAAEVLEISLRTYQNWEQGRTVPPPYVARLVEKVLREHQAG